MQVLYKELMDALGVGYELSPYETRPWYLYDEAKGIECNAEVRVGPGAEDVEAEIQFIYEDRDPEDGEDRPKGLEQIMLLKVLPLRDKLWTARFFLVKGQIYHGKIYDWEKRACQFFLNCIQDIQMGELPDIEELIEGDLTDAKGRGGRGKIGKKAPKVNPSALMGMKR
jgi:hypothetical protein